MSVNRVVFSGKVIFAEFKTVAEKPLLDVTISVYSGEKKKDGEQYAPSFLVKFPLWGNYASAMVEFISVGSTITVDGKMSVPNTYVNKDGEAKSTLQLRDVSVEDVHIRGQVGEEAEATVAPKATAKAKSKTSQPAAFEVDPEAEVPF
jgi:single-stranded DNA-binding protein